MPDVKTALSTILGEDLLQAGIKLGLSETYLLRDASVKCFLAKDEGPEARVVRERLAEILARPHVFA